MPKDIPPERSTETMLDSVLINEAAVADGAFAAADWPDALDPSAPGEGELTRFDTLDAVSADAARGALLANDADPARLVALFETLEIIVVPFPSFADGRGFSLARRLRALGYTGRLRARGHVLPDQYAYARAVGFDEVEIGADQARRQPIEDWVAAADRPGWFPRRRKN